MKLQFQGVIYVSFNQNGFSSKADCVDLRFFEDRYRD